MDWALISRNKISIPQKQVLYSLAYFFKVQNFLDVELETLPNGEYQVTFQNEEDFQKGVGLKRVQIRYSKSKCKFKIYLFSDQILMFEPTSPVESDFPDLATTGKPTSSWS
jgi:hypothetical protein